MRAPAAQRLAELEVFIQRDLPRLGSACDRELLPFAKLLHHIRRATLDVADLIDELDQESQLLLGGHLQDVLSDCERISRARGHRPNWVRDMLPDLHAVVDRDTVGDGPCLLERVLGG